MKYRASQPEGKSLLMIVSLMCPSSTKTLYHVNTMKSDKILYDLRAGPPCCDGCDREVDLSNH